MREFQTAINSMELHHINKRQTRFLIREMPEYFTHGIELQPGSVVVDVGANIGVFAAHVIRLLEGSVQLFSFEPLPPIFEILKRNTRDYFGDRVKIFPFGLAAEQSELDFTYFPASPMMSSMHRGQKEIDADVARCRKSAIRVMKEGGFGRILRLTPQPLIELALWSVERFYRRTLRNPEVHRVGVRPLSAVIDEFGIANIDLLKVDVEGAEVDVLNGINDGHWSRIRQVVIEIENWTERMPPIRSLLESHGFEIHLDCERWQKSSADLGLLYAAKR